MLGSFDQAKEAISVRLGFVDKGALSLNKLWQKLYNSFYRKGWSQFDKQNLLSLSGMKRFFNFRLESEPGAAEMNLRLPNSH